MKQLYDLYDVEEKNRSGFGIKIYSCQDIIFCLMRLLFGILYTYKNTLWLPFTIFCVLFICKVIFLLVVIVSSCISSKHSDDYGEHEIAIQKLNIINKHTAFFTVVIPHILQFILCFYVASLLCINANKTEYSTLLWIIGVIICIINIGLIISTFDIFANEGLTITLSKNITFDTHRNYWGEGLIIIFWSLVYIICAIYCCYVTMETGVFEKIDYLMIFGSIVFILSIIQTIKCLNLPDIYKKVFGGIQFYDYISYESALLNCRKLYLLKESVKIFTLGISVSVFVVSMSFLIIELTYVSLFLFDTIAIAITMSLVGISMASSIFIIRRMCKVPLLKGLFYEEHSEHFSEYIEIHNKKCITYCLKPISSNEEKSSC